MVRINTQNMGDVSSQVLILTTKKVNKDIQQIRSRELTHLYDQHMALLHDLKDTFFDPQLLQKSLAATKSLFVCFSNEELFTINCHVTQ